MTKILRLLFYVFRPLSRASELYYLIYLPHDYKVSFSFLSLLLLALLSARQRTKGNGATARQKHAAVANGSAPLGIPPTNNDNEELVLLLLLQLNSNILLDRSGVNILAAARVDVNKARFFERLSLSVDELATNAAVDVSAIAAPIRFIIYNIL